MANTTTSKVVDGKVVGPVEQDERVKCDRCDRVFLAKYVYCVCKG